MSRPLRIEFPGCCVSRDFARRPREQFADDEDAWGCWPSSRWREKVKAQKKVLEQEKSADGTVTMVFQSPQSMGKAVRKIEKVMPKSPTKRAAVIGKILSTVSPKKAKLIAKLSLIPKKKVERKK